MPTLDDLVTARSSGKGKEELQQALLELLKGSPDILNSVATRQATDRGEVVSVCVYCWRGNACDHSANS